MANLLTPNGSVYKKFSIVSMKYLVFEQSRRLIYILSHILNHFRLQANPI